ncbi:MAG: substrate-binding domain-containing protein [Spirochaetales bacterium]|nr:substrate-binding domain-containing protein [Spirochaetales bacterium]
MRTIGLQLRFQDSYDMAVAAGVVEYARTTRQWRLKGQGPLFSETLADCDGLIARIESEEDARSMAALGIPVIDIANSASGGLFNQVTNDDYQTGVNAARYLKESGSRNWGWCGVSRVRWASQRLKGFLEGSGLSIAGVASFTESLAWWRQLYEVSEELEAWLSTLPKPISLFCCNDISAMKVELACQRVGIAIPDEVMVLGVDNETLICELATPSISSIQVDCRTIGYEAAVLLDGLLDGTIHALQSRKIAPLVVIERESTRYVHCSDDQVAQALRLIKREASYGLTAAEVAAESAISRRALEMRFKKERGRTILEEIVRQRLQEASRLLIYSSLTVSEVGQLSGFTSEHRFFALFKEAYGMTPLSYRKERRQL